MTHLKSGWAWRLGPRAGQASQGGRLAIVALVFVSILLVGATGYHWLEGWPWLDSLYMATITVTTVGFGETHPLTLQGRIFTIVLILLGVSGITYGFRTIADYVVAGELWQSLRRPM